jgi:polysaccharide biosynthesis/export protein
MKSAVLLICLSGAALVECAYLPTAGPTAGEVIDRGVQENQIRYDVVDVNSGVVAVLLGQPAESFRTRFGKYGKPAAPLIGIGDTLSVSIWEAAGGGLFGTSPTEHVSAGSHNVTIREQVVGRDGGISVPFAGRVPVAGRTTVEVQHEIERRLAEKAIEPQVIVTIAKSVTYAATVSGEVVNGAKVPQSVNGDRMLDLIALAGGAKAAVYNTFVRLSRNTVTMPMERLVSNPAENIYAQPGDV